MVPSREPLPVPRKNWKKIRRKRKAKSHHRCSRGRVSRDVAENLCEQGYDAVSLKGGYIAWLMAEIKKQEADEICDSVEKSLRKKFHKNIFSKFAKAINQYELVKEGDRIAVCISGGKDSMLMAKLFQELKKHNKFPFEVKFLVMDPGYSRRTVRSSRRTPGS